MAKLPNILSITGSDGTGGAGVQADVKTITALGGNALTAISSVTVQSRSGIHSLHPLPADVVAGQVRAIIDDAHPEAIKLGLVNDAAAIAEIRNYIVGCRHIVSDPGIISSHGTRLMGADAMAAFSRHIIPETTLLLLRCNEAELLLGTTITTDDDMLRVARQLCDMGAQWVMLRGGQHSRDRLTALLYSPSHHTFFSSYNIEGWQRHGVGGALSSAIATRLAFGDDVPAAVRHAHDYLHSQVVYAVRPDSSLQRPAERYNRLLDLIAAHIRTAHDVAFYADRLAITPRYLSRVTRIVVGKTPKQIIDEYLLREVETLLRCTPLSIQQISSQLGFASQMQFCKFVQSRCHCTPTELRRRSAIL